MAKKKSVQAADYIAPLYINGMQGRMLHMPARGRKKLEILYVYGHHSSLERWWGMIELLNQYGSVTAPDLPGFGGMDSLYKIGEKPTLDTMADYLAAFIKLRYKRKRIVIVGLSYGFVVATRMLQRYPQLAKKCDMVVSIVGFTHHSEFTFSRPRMLAYRALCKLSTTTPVSIFYKNVLLHPTVIRLGYAKTYNAKKKFAAVAQKDKKQAMDFEVHLWRCNDIRTHAQTNYDFLKLNNLGKRVKLPLWHVEVKNDNYFDHYTVVEHLRTIYDDVNVCTAKTEVHAPSVIASKKDVKPFVPRALQQAFRDLAKKQ
ncbi:MAG: alpha/beta hydrolase [Candidatus Saccharibacteria bacterium]|nr:alpha/beta hydrolase [Candidatus Saccharibacteria bacterium]